PFRSRWSIYPVRATESNCGSAPQPRVVTSGQPSGGCPQSALLVDATETTRPPSSGTCWAPRAPRYQRRHRRGQLAVAAAGADLAPLALRGPHDLRHTFATWLEDAAIPSRVIDELMGHASGRRDRGASGSPMGRVYRETTPAMVARVTAALDDRFSQHGTAGSGPHLC